MKYAVCVDSDGCAMDTMTVKHEMFFAPFAALALNPKDPKSFVEDWNDVNLYKLTRGINRFESFALFLEKYESELQISGVDIRPFLDWIHKTSEFSESSLNDELTKSGEVILKIALEWSKKVNQAISSKDPKSYSSFSGVKEALEEISKHAEIFVVSSANKKAVLDEWSANGLIPFVNEINTQEDGSKKSIVASIIDRGFDVDHVLMIGDATKDRDAALDNGVLYYPILARRESESWKRLMEGVFQSFLNGSYRQEHQSYFLQEFEKNLS